MGLVASRHREGEFNVDASVRESAVRNGDRHGRNGVITADGTRLRLTGGSVTLDRGLSARILRVIDGDAGG